MSDLDPYFHALRRTTEPDAARLARLRAPKPPAALPWATMGLGALALAAAWFLFTGVQTVEVDRSIVAAEWTGGAQELPLGRHVQATVDGHGMASGTADNVDVQWHAGSVTLTVDPAAHIKVAVHTPEGVFRVVGTVFTVDRSALGTELTVAKGEVVAVCAQEPPQSVRGGDGLLCLPTTAAGWLRRVSALQSTGDHGSVVLAAEAALEMTLAPALVLEFQLHRVAARAQLGDDVSDILSTLVIQHPHAAQRIESLRKIIDSGGQ